MISGQGTEKLFSMEIFRPPRVGKRSRKVLMNNSFSFDGRSLRVLLYKPVLSGLYIQEYFI